MSFNTKSNYQLHLNFHGLGKPSSNVTAGGENYWVDAGLFAAVLDQVRGREEVYITIDDSNESDYTVAFPLLRERKLKASFFVVATRIDQKGFLSSQQIKTLCAEGMTIGNHGMWHSRWKGMSPPQLHEELVTARDIIERITNVPVTEAACPFGSYDRNVLETLRKQGYQRAFTSDGGVSSPTSWLQPRNTVRRSQQLEEILNLINAPPSGVRKLWRDFKITLKSWR
jgi:peptidoglycan/xylan/chitin deacetylase (PgdA/CDA1 family)